MNKPNYPKPELTAFTLRGNTIETLYYSWICVLDKNKKLIYKKGNIDNKIFLRSALKPIQAINVIENNISITLKELAIICASHSGSEKHIKSLKQFAQKNNINLSNLKCGVHLPFNEIERKKFLLANKKPSLLHNNCSGKHLGMLAVCKKNNWDLKTYLKPTHPIQKSILKTVTQLSETKNISTATDGCGIPTFAMPVINIAKMFLNFSSNKKYSRIISAMKKYPYYTGEHNQIDSEIMNASKKNLICKVGAEGIIVAATDKLSIVVKVADGSPKIRAFIILKLLLKFGLLKTRDIKNKFLKEISKGEIKNHAGKLVGKLQILL